MRKNFIAVSAPIGGDLDHPEVYSSISADMRAFFDNATYFASKTAHLATLKAAQEYAEHRKSPSISSFCVCYGGTMRFYDYELNTSPAKLAGALIDLEKNILQEIRRDFLFYAALKLRADNSEAEVERP